MTEAKHTCANDDGLRDAGHTPEPCIACDVRVLYQSFGTDAASDYKRDRLDRIVARVAELEASESLYRSNYLDAVERIKQQQTELAQLNPYRDPYAKRPDEPLALFIWRLRYYAGMLEHGDNWSHSLCHIQECCSEFETVIQERSRKSTSGGG